MLNELKTLADSIQAAGFSSENWDDKFREIKVKGSPCFIVSVSCKGTIEDIRFLEPDKAKCLRTWQGGSLGQCFPCFNFLPFYELVDDKKNPLPATQRTAAIKGFISDFLAAETPPESVGPIRRADRSKADLKTGKCLGNVAAAFFEAVTADAGKDDPFVSFQDAMSNLCPAGDASTFNGKLLSYLRLHVSPEMALQKYPPTVWSLLFQRTTDVVLFFDCSEPMLFPIASERGMKTVNARLLTLKADGSTQSLSSEKDAFGLSVSLDELAEKLPEVKLPGVLANTKLRSMSGESKCQTRYGHIDAESFPVGAQVRKAAKAALSWISSPEREGKTWAIAGANELVFAYPKNMPPSPPLLARLFGNGRSSAEMDKTRESRFEQYAAEALSGMKTLAANAESNVEIEVFAIKKADKARRKIVFYRNYTLAKLEVAVSSWLAGADNIPPILLRKWPTKDKGEKAAKGTKPVFCEFRAPLPIAATGLVYTMWSQDGNEKFEPKFRSSFLYEDFPVFDGLELFLGESVATGLTERMLSLLMQGMGTLCVAAGNLTRKREVLTNARAVAHLETALPLFGILLHKLNRTKETYMENVPYLIGKFLNLADGLHAVWCRNVRDGQLPPQLLGSSLFASFQLNPVQGFANAGMRIKPYIDWAKTNQTGDIALSRWFVGEFGRVTAAIEKAGIPTRLSDADKAEMLLGYLSSSGKSVESDSSDISVSDVHPTF